MENVPLDGTKLNGPEACALLTRALREPMLLPIMNGTPASSD